MAPREDITGAIIKRLDLGAGPLTVAIKDCIDIAGHVTTCGSLSRLGAAPAKDHAAVVDSALSAGCRIIGKTNMHEFAFGMTGVNKGFGTPVNPAWPDRIPGGSSSGSAVAVAAGLCDFAIGTDTGGSVRQPAICCGIFGMKPTFGRIDRTGCMPAESSLDCIGVFARSASMLTQAMQAIDPTLGPVTPLKKAPRLSWIESDPEPVLGESLRLSMMEGAPDALGITLPHFEAAFGAGLTIIAAETAAAFGPLLDGTAPIGADVRARLAAARRITQEDVDRAEEIRRLFTAEVDAALEDNDALVSPALPDVPPTLAEAGDPARILPLTRFLRPFNLSGHPAIVLPILVGKDRLPAGIQIIGRKGCDARLCAIAQWVSASLADSDQKECLP